MRSKQKNPKKTCRRYRQYSSESLTKAYESVKKGGISIRKAAKQFGVPIVTLHDRISGHVDHDKLKCNETLFTAEEELSLVEFVESLAQLGYGATNTRLKEIAGDMAFSLGKRRKNRPLSNDWLSAFMKRWDQRIHSVKPASLEMCRAKASTPETVDQYFANLSKTIQENRLEDKPQFIFNIDETGIQPEHRPPNIIAPVQHKAQAITSPRSTTTTIIAGANALGNYVPPFFVFKGKRANPDLMKGCSTGAKFTTSDSGWSNAQIFRTYLEEHFLPYVRQGSNNDQPILAIFDGHTSHVTKPLIEWAVSQNLILFVLPAHTSHILQPLDVAVFGPFKGYYYRECATYMRENMGQAVTKYTMVEIACKAYLRAFTPSNITAAFKKAGIYPLNGGVVDKERLYPCEGFRDKTPLKKVNALKSGKEALDEYLRLKHEGKVQPEDTQIKPCGCKCSCNSGHQTKVTKPTSGGRAITEDSFLKSLDVYEKQQKDKDQSKQTTKRKSMTSKNQGSSPQPSTSGASVMKKSKQATHTRTEVLSDVEMLSEETEVCCVCNMFYPPAENKPFLKIVNWAFCDSCSHCVHLSFCHDKRAIRRGETFLCPHCA